MDYLEGFNLPPPSSKAYLHVWLYCYYWLVYTVHPLPRLRRAIISREADHWNLRSDLSRKDCSNPSLFFRLLFNSAAKHLFSLLLSSLRWHVFPSLFRSINSLLSLLFSLRFSLARSFTFSFFSLSPTPYNDIKRRVKRARVWCRKNGHRRIRPQLDTIPQGECLIP